VPVLCGITDTSMTEALGVARHAADAGVSALVMAQPYYQPIPQSDLWHYTSTIAKQLPLPLVLYEMPSHTKLNFTLETVRKAMDLPNVIGLKDSSGSFGYYAHVIELRDRHRPDWTLLCGPEEMIGPTVMLGGNGGVTGSANVFPNVYGEVYNAAVSRDLNRFQKAQANVLRVFEALYSINDQPTKWIRCVKAALSQLGICSDRPADPIERFPEATLAKAKANLETVRDLLPAAVAA
jgi:dihydrodipicolinate synthase/N-acetylneuraminate lyase